MQKILAFDISTSKVGISSLTLEREILYNDVLIFKKNLTLLEKAQEFEKFLYNKKYLEWDENNIIIVEEPLMNTTSGGMAYITSLLQRFNGMCSYILYDVYGKEPLMVNPSTSRTTIGLHFKRKTPSKDKKKLVIDFIKQQFGDNFTYEITKAGNPKPGTDDRADSLVLALYGLKMLNTA